ncbi:hypothetical protein MUP59_11305, partial [Candidatus Bathyarchaeota archaeon]|nr:hypothetical protein [Candidatus Bathyarchaeota archaeon]
MLSLNPEKLKEYSQRPNEILAHYNSDHTGKISEHIRYSGRRFLVDEPKLSDFFKLCYLDAVGYARRRKKKSVEELFPVVLNKYVSAVLNFIPIRDRLGLDLGRVTILQGDAKDLSNFNSDKLTAIDDESIGGIITSPPYSFAIDYLEEDRLQLEYMGYDIDSLRQKMIGLYGRGMAKVQNYLRDMDKIIGEMSRALKRGRYAVIVVGSN